MKYLAILFATDPGGCGQSFTCSDDVNTDDVGKVYSHMKAFAKKVAGDDIDTILLIENDVSGNPPKVVKHWTAANGDFEEGVDSSGEDCEACGTNGYAPRTSGKCIVCGEDYNG